MQSHDSFEDEIISDAELDELDDFIRCVLENLDDGESGGVAVSKPERIKAITETYRILKHITKDTSAEVSCNLNEPFNSMGYISVVGADLLFKNPRWIAAVAKLASNFNAFPKVNGTIQIDFTFHGLTECVEGEEM